LYVPVPWNVCAKVPFAATEPFVKVESVPEPGPVPLHAADVHRVTVCEKPVVSVHVTVVPSDTDSADGRKQKNDPPHPLALIVTLALAAPAVDVPATSENANVESVATARAISLRTASPLRERVQVVPCGE
jgi:hypothetical protein